MQEAERAQPVVDGHHDRVAPLRETRAPVDGLRTRAGREGASVEPHQDRPARAVRGGRPDVILAFVTLGVGIERRVVTPFG